MAKSNFETLEVYQISEELSDEIWNIVLSGITSQKVRSAINLYEPQTV